MTTYIALFKLTDAVIKAAKDSPRRLDAAKKLLSDMGGEMKQFYMVMGEFDFVGICEALDDAVTARFAAWGPWLRAHEDLEGIAEFRVVDSGRIGVPAIADIQLRARSTLHRSKQASGV